MIFDDRWTQIKALFHAALERPPEERAAFLQQISVDSASRAEVERLLAAHLEAGAFLEPSPVTSLPSLERAALIGQLVGHYRIEHLLGAGGMGVVYAARDLDLKRVVALKIVASDLVDRQTQLRREAQRASQLNHPNVCTIHEVGVSDGMTYFVMERVEGRTLSELITEPGLPLENVLSYGSQIAEALAHAHAHGLVHRDLKSSNVMVTRDGRVKVLDFGLACSTGTEHIGELTVSTQGPSHEGLVAGTLPYMAPELLRAEPADARTDLWALGVVLYEMAARRRPFEGTTGFEVSAAILYQPPPPLPVDVPQSLQAIIRRLLAKIPGERYTHAGEAAAAIDAVRSEFAARFGAPRHGSPGNVPVVRTSFVGRVNELASLVREVELHRLVTLTGVGGSGKTRLALETAERMRSAFPDGVWWVDLAPIADETRIEEAIASTLGILNAQRPPRESLLEYVGGRRLLIVLDNCEHLIAAAADLADAVLANSRDVHVLATSREGLGVSGERILPVPSLSMAGPEAAADFTSIANCDAVRLFAARATAVQPRFSITSSNAPVILEICRRLDGIPLAVELAAAHARLLSVEQIRTLLGDRLALRSRRGRAVPRHQTLGAALQWSYDLLTAEERRTLRALAVFHGGWTLSAAAAVCGESGDGDGVLDLLWRLVDKSLIEVMHTDGVEARYRLLEMVRQFALDQLIAASEASRARDRHAEYYVRRFELAAADLLGPREPETVAALDLELDNLLAALHQIGTRDEGVQRLLRAVSDGWLFWVSRGRIAVARGVLANAIQRAPDSITPAAARALMASSMLARFAGDSTQALGDAERSVSLYRHLECPDPSGLAFALFQRAGAAISFTPERAMPRQDLERGIELSITVNDEVMRGICLNMLSGLDLADGNIEAAEARLVEALSTARTTQSPYLLILYLANLASVRMDRGRWLESVALEREAIELVQRSGNRHFAPLCVLVAARILAASGDLSSAHRLSGAAFGMWATIGERPAADDTEWMDGLGVPADESRREEYARLKEEGRALAFDAAIAEALRALQQCSQSVHGMG